MTGFGAALQNARIQQGYNLNAVARRLRIRPDILKAIESEDFEHMPPHGYTRNMVNAYARFLGLNSTAVTRQYLDEYYAYQVHEAREQTGHQTRDFNLPRETRSRKSNSQEETRASQQAERPQAAPGRTLYTSARDSSETQQAPHVSERGTSEARMRRANNGALPTTQYTNFYSGPKASSVSRSKLPFIIAGVVILILLIVILVLVFGPSSNNNESSGYVPVEGVSEIGVPSDSLSDDDASTQNTVTQRAPVDFTFNFSVASGESSYVEVYLDGAPELVDTLTGPLERSFTSVGTIRFITSNAGPLTAYIDGEPVALEAGTGGIVDNTYSFEEILAQWNEANPTANTDSNTAAE